MRPVRFVALSEDKHSLILTDEAGRMLSLNVDDSVLAAVQHEQNRAGKLGFEIDASLTPRDIQARIRAGDPVAEVARLANVPVEKVLRFAGPVLQERAAIVDFAHRSCSTNTPGERFGELATERLIEHGIEPQSVVWDSYRRENGAWRICAQWQSGRATARAVWNLDKPRLQVKPVDDMAHFLCDPPLNNDDDAVAHAGATSRDVQDGRVRGRPHVAASRSFGDDQEVGAHDGPVVPALSVLRRNRDEGDERSPVARPAAARPYGERRVTRPGTAPEPVRERATAQRAATAGGRGGSLGNSLNSSLNSSKGAAAALGLGPTRPTKTRGSTLPSWDDILFGTDRG
ncbi:MAG: septation protein SepH [Mycobacteriales bacterium]